MHRQQCTSDKITPLSRHALDKWHRKFNEKELQFTHVCWSHIDMTLDGTSAFIFSFIHPFLGVWPQVGWDVSCFPWQNKVKCSHLNLGFVST